MKNRILFLLFFAVSASVGMAQITPGAPREATAAEVVAGTSAASYISPRRLAGGGGTGNFSSLTDSALTAGRVTFAGTGGLLSDDADMTFSTDTLTVSNISIGGIPAVTGRFNVISDASMNVARFVTSDFNGSTTGSGFSIIFGAATGNTFTRLQASSQGGSNVQVISLNGASATTAGAVLVGGTSNDNQHILQVFGTGGISTNTIGGTLAVKSGTNAKAGTFTLASGTATVANTSVTANSVIVFSMKTPSGTITSAPYVSAITAATSFVVTGAATNNSTYNYVILEVN